jgi:hypothetical protein
MENYHTALNLGDHPSKYHTILYEFLDSLNVCLPDKSTDVLHVKHHTWHICHENELPVPRDAAISPAAVSALLL